MAAHRLSMHVELDEHVVAVQAAREARSLANEALRIAEQMARDCDVLVQQAQSALAAHLERMIEARER